MIKLRLKRIAFKDTYTIGKLYINDTYFCDTIEDKVRSLPSMCPNQKVGKECKCKEKVYAQTAIPSGTYKVVVNVSPKFKRLLPRLLNVPHFEGILIHNGSDERSSAGCIIVGENKVVGKVINSTYYMNKLTDLLKDEKDIIISIE